MGNTTEGKPEKILVLTSLSKFVINFNFKDTKKFGCSCGKKWSEL